MSHFQKPTPKRYHPSVFAAAFKLFFPNELISCKIYSLQ